MLLSRPKLWIIFMVLIVVISDAASAEIISSPSDDRKYAAQELSNGLKVLLISDPNTDKSAAALDVRVGSGDDPENRDGLAHFLEHMLFLGTERYPEAGEYQAFIQQYGGSDNAYTMPDHTNYYFDIQTAYLYEALDRFSQFFVAPLFNAEFVERERAVVAAEFSSKLQSDGRRFLAARRQAFNPLHPEFGFAVGNEKTLADREEDLVRNDLINFFNERYHAHRMTLVVLGQEPIDTLEGWVTEMFEAIPAGEASNDLANVPIYLESTLPAVHKIKPVKEIRQAIFSFAIPSARDRYAEKPLSYIANLLGHEGPGSLLAALKKRGWADALSAGGGLDYDKYGTFEVNISLTKEGLDHYQQIGSLLFAMIREIRGGGVADWMFEEQKRLAEIDFSFREDVDAYTLVRAFAARMHQYPVRDLYFAPYRYDAFNQDLIDSYLGYLQPENLHLLLLGPELETDQIEMHYGVEYSLEKAHSDLIRLWESASLHEDLYIPKANPFIPIDLVVRPDEANVEVPVPHDISDGFTLWFDSDPSYEAPRGNFYVSIRSPISRLTPRAAVLTDLYTKVVSDQLVEFSYPAQLAGLGYDLYDHQRGFTLKISGYTDKQDVLLEAIMQVLSAPDVTPERFERLRTDLIRQFRNISLEHPYAQGLADLRRLLIDNAWWPDQQIDVAKTLTPDQLVQYIPKLLKSTESVALTHGSYTEEEALALANIVHNKLLRGRQTVSVPHAQVIRLPKGETFFRTLEIESPDSLSIVYLQGSSRSIDERARFYLAGQVLNAPFYQRLRTEKQMGYIVFCGAIDIMEVPGFALVVQSPNRNPENIQKEMEQFLEEFLLGMVNLEEIDFVQHRDSLVGDIMRREEQLRDRSNRYWLEIDRQNYSFDYREKLVNAINKISLKEFREFFSESLVHHNVPRIVLRSYGAMQDSAVRNSNGEIDSVGEFRARMDRFVLSD